MRRWSPTNRIYSDGFPQKFLRSLGFGMEARKQQDTTLKKRKETHRERPNTRSEAASQIRGK